MYLQNVLRSKNAQMIFSIIWGFGLATLFRQVCKGRGCVVYRAPSAESIKGKTFRFDGKCYKYTPRSVKCPSPDKIVPPEEFVCSQNL